MDPYETLNLETETSLLMMGELMKLGHQVDWVEMEGLSMEGADLWGQVRSLRAVKPFALTPPVHKPLGGYDALVVRKDPPFEINYYHSTLLLDHLPKRVVQINPVAALRQFNEKLFGLFWPHLTPPTWTGMDLEGLLAFALEHQKIVVKPLDDCSGRGITLVEAAQPGLRENLADLLGAGPGKKRFVTAQRFIPKVSEGDKRIYLVNGKPLGWVNRVPAAGNFLGNIHQGAVCKSTEITAKEAEIVEFLGPQLRSRGLFLVGLDLVGEWVTEINLTSPSAIRQINEVMGKNLEIELVAQMVEYVRAEQGRAKG